MTEEALGRRRGFTARAVRAVMRAREMALLAIIAALVKIRDSGDPVAILDSMVRERDIRIIQLEELVELLRGRIGRVDSRHRTRYTPAERFKVILFKQTYSLTIEDTAKLFLVSAQTVARWIEEAIKDPVKTTIGSLLKAVPPLMSYPDILRDTVQLMDRAGFGGLLSNDL